MKLLLLSCLVLQSTLAFCAQLASTEEGDGYQLQDVSVKGLKMESSCSSSDASRITEAFEQALDIAQSGISTIDWLLNEYAASSDNDQNYKKRRISMPLKTMAGDNLAPYLRVKAKRNKLRHLRDIFNLVRSTTSQQLIVRCNADFLIEHGPEDVNKPPWIYDDEYLFWDTIRWKWVPLSHKKCDDIPMFVYPGNTTYPDQLVFCPIGLQLLDEKAFIRELRKRPFADLDGTFIDVLAVSPPAWIFQALLQTRHVGAYDNLYLGNGLRAYGWLGVRTLALKFPEMWIENAGTMSYIALAWYMNKWNWGTGQATDPGKKEKDLSVLPADYAEQHFGKGKGKARENIDAEASQC